LFDALFHILPLGTDMDKVEPTHARGVSGDSTTWQAQAQTRLRDLIAQQPVLVQISVAKRLRDQSERLAREQGQDVVSEQHVSAAGEELGLGATA
jgi:chlorophyllide a reductase subunit Z